jgi:hypothetical protein
VSDEDLFPALRGRQHFLPRNGQRVKEGLHRIERRPARLDLTAYPHLPQTRVKTTSAADYAVLLPGRAA